MIIWNDTTRFNAPKDHVYKCYMDLSYFERELKRQQGKEITLEYDRTKGTDATTEVTVNTKSGPMIKFITQERVDNELLRGEVVPLSRYFERMGNADIMCRFTGTEEYTDVRSEIVSHHQPRLLWKVFIKVIVFILKLQSKSDRKRFIRYVETTV